MAVQRPLVDEASLLAASDETWHNLTQSDWMEAFQSHPRIGESNARQFAPSQAAAWAGHEQKRIADAETGVKIALEEGNREDERRFGWIFIGRPAGKFAGEILGILGRRVQNGGETQ